MTALSEKLRRRLDALSARDLLAARVRTKSALIKGRSPKLAGFLLDQIDTELERRRAAQAGTPPSRRIMERWRQVLDSAIERHYAARFGAPQPGGDQGPTVQAAQR